jgi:hypothetical protein
MASLIVPRPMKPIGYAASIIEPPHGSARARCFDEEPRVASSLDDEVDLDAGPKR